MTLLPTETLLKRTTSRCPVCHADSPAEVWKTGGPFKSRVVLRRTCAEHGMAEAVISSDARFYWLAQGDPKNACCGGNACSAEDDSFGAGPDGLLEAPVYTKPASWRGLDVPPVLLSGHHGQIARWRAEQSRRRTHERSL